MAEAHPVGFRFPMQARERGATLIHVDPHFSRTSAMCQQYVNIRTGTDIAFLGGLIRYILENDKWFHEYVMAFTNATTIITDEYGDPEDLAGLFTGYNLEKRQYDAENESWQYASEGGGESHGTSGHHKEGSGSLDNPVPEKDPTDQSKSDSGFAGVLPS